MLLSFGYHKGAPTGVHKTFDVRDLPHNLQSDAVDDRYHEILDYARTHPKEIIAIGCDAGKHRSVALTENIANALRRSYMHRDA